MVAVEKRVWTPEEYLAYERASQERHELINGEIRLMSGASEEQVTIVINTASSLHSQLRKRPCKTYASDLRVKLKGNASYAYPDVVVVCGERMLEDDKFDTLLNPTVIFEVLYPSTEVYDRGRKFEFYRALDSLQEYVLIAQDRPHVEHYRRADDEWILQDFDSLESTLTLASIECTLTLADIYEKVDVSNPPPLFPAPSGTPE